MSDWRLCDAARRDGHRLHVFDSLGSTSTEAMARARAGENGPLWIAARRQEAGRGRRGNAWASPPGNLAASVLWPVPGVEPGRLAGLGFVAGLSLAQAVDAARGDATGITLKWPNDLVVAGAKLAGILLETETLPGGRRAVVIGFGLNVAAAPRDLPGGREATCLAEAGIAARAETVLEHLSGQLAALARVWDRGRNFAGIRELWLARASGLGSPIAVLTGTERLDGIFHEIDEGGRLVIIRPDGTKHTVTAGEVHFGTAATAA